jgi:hypothetical protein
MAKEKAIINSYDSTFPARDRYDSKYFKYLGNVRETSGDILEAFRSKDIQKIRWAIKDISNSINNHIVLIGLACVIIDREQLYIDAGYKSYLDFVKVLYEETGLSPQSFSAAKIIVERYIDHNPDLKKYGFTIDRNSNKLLFLEAALANHADKAEVFRRIAQDKFADFVAYSKTPDGRKVLPPPEPLPKINIKNGKIIVDGKKYEDLPEKLKKTVEQDFSDVYSIRHSGNEPVITPAYDEREARILKNRIAALLKEIRASR